MKVRLGDYIEQIRGVSYSPADLHSALNEKSVILLRANNINDNKINFDDVVFVDKNKVSKNQYLQEGDILVCTSSGSKHLVGKAAYVDKAHPVTFGAFCKIVRPKTSIKRYIGYFFESPFYRTRISELSGGANINNIRNEHIDELVLELPEESIQNNICLKLNKISILIEKRKQQLEKLDLLVKSKFIEMFGDSEFNTKGFPLFKLSDLCTVGSSKRIYQNEQSKEGVPFLRISDLNNRIDGIEDTCELYIPEETYKSFALEGLIPNKGDILITARGTLGRCYIVKESDKFYFQDGMITWLSSLSNKVTSLYISYLFGTEGIKKQIDILQAGSTVAYLSIAMTKKLNIMLPPIELQNEFASFVEQTDKTKSKIKQSLEKFDILKKALMQKYFG